MDNFAGKAAIITGAASGIGLALARALLLNGARVFLVDIDQESLEEAATSLGAPANVIKHRCDVTRADQVASMCDAAFEQFGQIDLLFSNAGVMPDPQAFVMTSEDTLRWVFEVNVFGNWMVCREVAKRMIDQGSPAHIVVTGSENSIAPTTPMCAAYNASKHAVLGFTGILRMELPEFIGLSILCPGVVATNLTQSEHKRLDRFGGPADSMFDGTVMPGMQPARVAELTLDAVKRGEHFIMTHNTVKHMVDERYAEILDAFEAQTSPDDGTANYDSRKLWNQMVQVSGEKI